MFELIITVFPFVSVISAGLAAVALVLPEIIG